MQLSKSDRFKPVEIGNVGGTRAVLQAVQADMTAIGGAPMLAEVDRRVGLCYSSMISSKKRTL